METWTSLSSWKQGGYFEAKHVKFEPTEFRRSDIEIGKSWLADFGLVQDGCKMNISYATSGRFVGSAFIVSFKTQVTANGYFFQIADYSVDSYPVKWTVQASTDNGSSWQDVGASVWRLSISGVVLFYPQLAFDTPIERRMGILVDYRHPWQWCTVSVVRGIILFTGTFLSLCFALAHHEESSKISWILMFFVLGLCFIISALGYNWQGLWREACEKWIYVPVCFVIPIGLAFFESKCIAFLFLFSTMGAMSSFLADCVVYGQDGKCFFINSFQNIYIFMFTVAFVSLVLFFNHMVIKKARILVLEDKIIYDTLWNKISLDPLAQTDLQLLHRLTQSVLYKEYGTGLSAGPRQYNAHFLSRGDNICQQMHSGVNFRRLSRAAIGIGISIDIYSAQEINARIDNLDQLYAQAYCLHPLLIHKTKEWALKSDGCVMIHGWKEGHSQVLYALYSSVQGDMKIKWCEVKSLQRSVEKVVRAYGQVRNPYVSRSFYLG
jgi:hypothetical protein